VGKGRFEAFSDGVFAIAITLLVLEFRLPDPRPGLAEGGLPGALLALWPQYLVYVASFATIGIMWMNHHSLFSGVPRVSYAINIINLLLLMLVAFLPFPTEVLARYGPTHTGVAFYGLILLLCSLAYRGLWYIVTPQLGERRDLLGYLTVWNPWATIGFVAYLTGIGLAYVSPIASLVLFGLIAGYYALSGTLRSVNQQP
jgi:uncharacterized membrane protein